MKTLLLVATMSGTAEMVAGEIADALEEEGIATRILRMEKATSATLASAEQVIICTSTYGTGEVPDNGKPLLEALQQDRPDLSHLRYGIFSLGSGRYPQTFCGGGEKFDALLAQLGAISIVERHLHDDQSGVHPEDAAIEWAEEWIVVQGKPAK